jgi:hypothetical protein
MGIDISIQAGLTEATSNASASGVEQHVITDKEVETFQIGDGALKGAVEKFFGKRPNDVFLHSDTPWGDLYKTYQWPQVQTVVVVQSATITAITSEPVIVAQQTFKNTSSVKATFNAGISQTVTNTATSGWSKSDDVTVTQKISYEIGFLGAGTKGETSLSYSHSWGQTGSESKAVTVGSTSGVSVPLDPGQAVNSVLTASRGVMKVRVVYRAYLVGDVAVNYDPTYNDHHFWALDVGSVMAAAGIPNERTMTEDIEIGFYSNSQIDVRDVKTEQKKALFSSHERHAG